MDLHPAGFRERFGAEMQEIFAKENAAPRLLADAASSLARQWILRPEFRQPAAPASFGLIEPYRPRPAAFVYGGVITIGVFWFVGTAMSHATVPRFWIGVHHPSPHLLPVSRASVEGAELSATVKVAPPPEDPLRPIAAKYFKIIRVLDALDADQDLIISQWEITAAPGALRRLDRNHDGKLSAEECGFYLGGDAAPEAVERARTLFMRENPVLAALDSNHDNEISASEIEHSAAALRTLDQNGDGSLEAFEVLPHRVLLQARKQE
jgi:hypothetical protein